MSCPFASLVHGNPQQTAQSTASERSTTADQAAAARAILDRWHKTEPVACEKSLHIVVWTPSDRDPPTDYQARLDRIMTHIQEFYASEMEASGFGRRTFRLDRDDDGKLIIHLVPGRHPTSHYATESGREIRNECLPVLKAAGLDADDETLVLFCNLATWDEQNKTFSHRSPYYASGTNRRGTAWQLDSPELDTKNLGLTAPMIRDRQYGRISLGRHNSIFVGGIAHELGHALGLPHNAEWPDELPRGRSLMGSGNRTYGEELRGEGRGSYLSFADAMQLAAHPQFSGSSKALTERGRSALDGLQLTTDGRTITVTGTVTGTPPIYGVVAYFDPEGNSDYDAPTATAVPDADGRFTLTSGPVAAGKAGRLRLVPLHVNGASLGAGGREETVFPYTVAADGTPDLSITQARLELQPVIDALNANDTALAKRLAAGLASPLAKQIAASLVRPTRPATTPAQADPARTSAPLTDFRPTEASVGWRRPSYDSVPDVGRVLLSGGTLHARGVYAHAPARHRYDLGEGWDRLTGQVGLLDGMRGSVRFLVRGDDKTLWASEIVREGQTVPFDVPVSGVTSLELITDPTEDGSGSDWGLWLAPTLGRDAPTAP